MKRVVLMALLGLGSITLVQGQHVRLGVTAGVSSTRLGGPRETSDLVPHWRLGLRGGVVAHVLLSSSGRLAAQTELLYSGQGFRLIGNNGGLALQRLHYLQLPVLAQVKLAKLWLEAGPEVSYLLGTRTTTGYGGLTGNPSNISLDPATFRRWELGYVLGAGYQCTEQLRLGLRHTGGLTTVVKPAASAENSRQRNQVVSLQATVLFGN